MSLPSTYHILGMSSSRARNVNAGSSNRFQPYNRGPAYRRGTAAATTSVLPTNIPTQMFGDNIAIFDGQFYQAETVNNIYSVPQLNPYELLLKHVASAAFHNSAQRTDPPRCHKHTRVRILKTISKWALEYAYMRKAWILWLNGAAGAGKSAIMQSVIELLLRSENYHVAALASFFFSRGDSTRNIMSPLIATLVYQMMREIPHIRDDVLQAIGQDPLVFDQSLEYQLETLIIGPLRRLPAHRRKLLVCFIDGLDECLDRDHQSHLLRTIGNTCDGRDLPIIFVVASRREPQILSEFGMPKLETLLQTVPLDNSKASDDIRRYLNAEFTKIKETHIHRRLLPPNWPPIGVVSELVEKASNQFIFASVVIKYLSSSRGNPANQLKVIKDLRLLHPSAKHPFALLDALYQYIFSQVPEEHLSKALDVLAYDLICSDIYSMRLFDSEPGEALEVIFADLTAVVHLQRTTNGLPQISFLHASLPDFLQDQSRSGEYFLDLKKYTTKLLIQFFERKYPDPLSKGYNWNAVAKQESWRLHAIWDLLAMATASQQLQHAVIKFGSKFHSVQSWRNAELRVNILKSLQDLNFRDEGKAYAHVLDTFAAGYAKFWTEYSDDVKNEVRTSPDLCARILEIRPDLADDPALDPKSNWLPWQR